MINKKKISLYIVSIFLAYIFHEMLKIAYQESNPRQIDCDYKIFKIKPLCPFIRLFSSHNITATYEPTYKLWRVDSKIRLFSFKSKYLLTTKFLTTNKFYNKYKIIQ